jgi:hypothetical protein
MQHRLWVRRLRDCKVSYPSRRGPHWCCKNFLARALIAWWIFPRLVCTGANIIAGSKYNKLKPCTRAASVVASLILRSGMSRQVTNILRQDGGMERTVRTGEV